MKAHEITVSTSQFWIGISYKKLYSWRNYYRNDI